ncbi:hypothetical protein J31TS4_43680 [Paenibacillus sp. J31TS4]|uniref:amidase domain-containing protein n=1 Tax=Paenibacillus sp. J31TS4 TaxID=2807195 RepID=UPI001B0A1B5F|nr:amidase domain-containing protein [Paenibacillus sp. J31TS4]GIP41088.1 hypothetical protein J31TS4_43680 [Paenibacillus sp. J31TS4]
MSWKSVIYRYADERSRMEIDYRLDRLAAVVRDDQYLDRLAGQLERLRAVRLERGWRAIRHEIRVRVKESGDGVRTDEAAVQLELHHRFRYESRSREQLEEWIEHERVVLAKAPGGWYIDRIEQPEAAPVWPDVVIEEGPGLIRQQGEGVRAAQARRPLLSRDVFGQEELRAGTHYNRTQVAAYADAHWNDPNPAFLHFEVDCTNYVSQCVFAGGAPMNYTGRRERGWWYRGRSGAQELWSFSWAVANGLTQYLASSRSGLQAESVKSARQLTIGDVICYDWDGTGRFGHTTIVTAISADGYPLVNAHTNNSRHRYWDYRDSYAWTERTVYRFYHILDRL